MNEEIKNLILRLESQLRNFNIEPYVSNTPVDAMGAVDILTNDELAETIASLKATLQAFGD